jgi:hypothetical protein
LPAPNDKQQPGISGVVLSPLRSFGETSEEALSAARRWEIHSVLGMTNEAYVRSNS